MHFEYLLCALIMEFNNSITIIFQPKSIISIEMLSVLPALILFISKDRFRNTIPNLSHIIQTRKSIDYW